MLTTFEENSVVELLDGRVGTVVCVYPASNDLVALLELDPEQVGKDGQMIDVHLGEVSKLLWSPSRDMSH